MATRCALPDRRDEVDLLALQYSFSRAGKDLRGSMPLVERRTGVTPSDFVALTGDESHPYTSEHVISTTRYVRRVLGDLAQSVAGEAYLQAGLGGFHATSGTLSSTTQDRARRSVASDLDQLGRDLAAAFDENEVESGFPHPAEELLGRAVRAYGRHAVATWLAKWLHTHNDLRPSILLCLGRLPPDLVWTPDLEQLVRAALADSSVVVRDAAVRAAEQWSGEIGLRLLDGHSDSEPWLRGHVERVLRDLRRSRVARQG